MKKYKALDGIEWIKNHYGLNSSIKKGIRIKYENLIGILVGFRGSYFKFEMQEGYLKGTRGYYHPTWRVEYEIDGKFIKPEKYSW
jgi:hypothetical protein